MQAAEKGSEPGAESVLCGVALVHAVLLATGALVLGLGLLQRGELNPLGLQCGDGVARCFAGFRIGRLFS
ncbi:hypothetical protein D3C85_1639260 [compost metagenome]